jgi:hypothetical protein
MAREEIMAVQLSRGIATFGSISKNVKIPDLAGQLLI